MTLRFSSEDNGNCRVYFTRSARGAVRILYCWQKSSGDGFEFLRCSRDGEPSHVVTGFTDTGKSPIQETPPFVAETTTGMEFIAWITRVRSRSVTELS